MARDSDTGESVSPERITIRGTVRWAFTENGRVIVQFASDDDLVMALRIWDLKPELMLRRPDDTSTLEFQLPGWPNVAKE